MDTQTDTHTQARTARWKCWADRSCIGYTGYILYPNNTLVIELASQSHLNRSEISIWLKGEVFPFIIQSREENINTWSNWKLKLKALCIWCAEQAP